MNELRIIRRALLEIAMNVEVCDEQRKVWNNISWIWLFCKWYLTRFIQVFYHIACFLSPAMACMHASCMANAVCTLATQKLCTCASLLTCSCRACMISDVWWSYGGWTGGGGLLAGIPGSPAPIFTTDFLMDVAVQSCRQILSCPVRRCEKRV